MEGAGELVIGLQRRDERGHRRRRIGAELAEPADKDVVVVEFQGRHPRHMGPALKGRGHPGILSQPVEGAQFAVGEGSEQVDNGLGHGLARRRRRC